MRRRAEIRGDESRHRGDPPADDASSRWDGTSLQTLSGTYGDYLGAKVAKVFPALVASRLRSEGQ